MRIAIAGATGAVGNHVVNVVHERGHSVVALSRSAGVDLFSSARVTSALEGVQAVIDVASISTTSRRASENFYGNTTTNLLIAGVQAGVDHHLALSILNAEKAPTGYYAGKLLQEQLVEDGPLPWTIVRTSQFHEFVGQILNRGKIGPLRAIPMMHTQPIAAREVAVRLIDLVEGGAIGRAQDLAGPQPERLIRLARAYGKAAQLPGRIVSIPLPGVMGRAMRTGILLPDTTAQSGTITFTQWLSARKFHTLPSRPSV